MGCLSYKRLDSDSEDDEIDTLDRQYSHSVESRQEGEVDPKVLAKFEGKCYLRRALTVEPFMLVYFATFLPLIPLTQQFVLEQVRTNMNLTNLDTNSSTCGVNSSSDLSDLDNQAQFKASHWMILFNIVLFMPGFFSTVILGSYSDQKGRKVGLVVPLVGGIIRCLLSYCVAAFGFRLEWLALGLAVEGLSGGAATFLMAGFSYIADITSHVQRSARIFMLEVSLGIGMVVGQIAIGFLIKAIDFGYCYVFYGCLHAVNLVAVLFLVIETRGGKREGEDPLGLFSPKHFVKIFRVYFVDTIDHRRWKVLLGMVLLFLSCVIELGSNDNITYFEIHQPLCFTPIMIGFWQAANYALRNIVGMFMVKLFNRKLGDTGLMVLSFVSGMTFYLLVAFTVSVLMMFLVIFASLFYSLLTPMVRSFTSKLCSGEEQGALFAGITMIQTLALVVGDTSFNIIYAATLHTNRGLVFIIEASCLGFGLILTILLIVIMRRESEKYLRLTHIVDVDPKEGVY